MCGRKLTVNHPLSASKHNTASAPHGGLQLVLCPSPVCTHCTLLSHLHPGHPGDEAVTVQYHKSGHGVCPGTSCQYLLP